MSLLNKGVNLVWFQTTKGHYGRQDLYKYTLKNIRDLSGDFSLFDNKIISLKEFYGDGQRTKDILKDFPADWTHRVAQSHDTKINDESPYKDYAYYLLSNYLGDIASLYAIYIAHDPKFLENEYTFLVEDDSPVVLKYPNPDNFRTMLETAAAYLDQYQDIFSIHFRRFSEPRNKMFGENPIIIDGRGLIDLDNPHDYNFQNQLFRTKDMVDVGKAIWNNWPILQYIHTERAVKLAIDGVFPDKNKHVSFYNYFGGSVHIGIQDADAWIKSYGLTR